MKFLILILIAIAGMLCGCGYQQSGGYDAAGGYKWSSLYREDVRTVAVPIFTNKDFHRGVEFSLTKAVINQLEAHSPYKVVNREKADTILEGQIVAVSVAPLSLDPKSALPQEQLMTMRINFIWKNLKTGQILLERRNFDQAVSYYPTLGEGSFVGTQTAVEKAALAIVQELQADW